MSVRHRIAAFAAALLGCACAGSVIASEFASDRVFVCAPLDAHACLNGFQCQQGIGEDADEDFDDDADEADFMRIDFRKGTMRARGRTALISHEIRTEGNVVIQGAESGYGWSIAIDETSGHLVATVVGKEAAFVFFGACTLAPL